MERPDIARRLVAEGVGTFTLMIGGTGAVVVAQLHPGTIGSPGIAAAFGLVVAGVIFAVGHLSGAHLNPAVTLGFALGRHFPWREVPLYMAVQIAGALAASASLLALFGSGPDLGVTRPSGVSDVSALVVEAGLTAFLLVVVMAVATDTRAAGALAALAVGITIALEALVFGPVTGASMNPARSIGPAVVSDELTGLWIYVIGPLVGGAVGVALYELLRGARPDTGPADAAAVTSSVPATSQPASSPSASGST